MAHITQALRNAPRSTTLSVTDLATRALAELATTSDKMSRATRGREAHALCDALFDPETTAYQQLIVRMIAEGLTSEDLLDQVIPDTARLLGQGWLSDERSFADVTIGTSRLQQTVRTIGARHEKDGLSIPTGHRALLILPDFEQHSLGSFIIANQLRRMGVWVQMAFDCETGNLSALLEDHPCSMIGLSLGSEQSLDHAPALVSKIRGLKPDAPIVLGGTILADTPSDYAESIGADYIADTARDALDFCQIAMPQETTLSRQFIDA